MKNIDEITTKLPTRKQITKEIGKQLVICFGGKLISGYYSKRNDTCNYFLQTKEIKDMININWIYTNATQCALYYINRSIIRLDEVKIGSVLTRKGNIKYKYNQIHQLSIDFRFNAKYKSKYDILPDRAIKF